MLRPRLLADDVRQPLLSILVFSSEVVFAGLHASSARTDIAKFSMPAMSPTMSEGGIAQWKIKEGETFSAGDVLLEVVSALQPPRQVGPQRPLGDRQSYH